MSKGDALMQVSRLWSGLSVGAAYWAGDVPACRSELAAGDYRVENATRLGRHPGTTRFFTAVPNPGALKQISESRRPETFRMRR